MTERPADSSSTTVRRFASPWTASSAPVEDLVDLFSYLDGARHCELVLERDSLVVWRGGTELVEIRINGHVYVHKLRHPDYGEALEFIRRLRSSREEALPLTRRRDDR